MHHEERLGEVRRQVWRAAFVCSVLILGLAGCGGGGGSGGGGGCSGAAVYDSYGYEGQSTQGEIGEGMQLDLHAHQTSGCASTQSIEGDLPPGLTFDSGTGRIMGVPAAGGHFTVTVKPLHGDNSSARLEFTITPLDGRLSQAMTLQRLNAPDHLAAMLGPRIAASIDGDVRRLWIGGYMQDKGQFELFKSTDEGSTWTADDAGGLIKIRGNSVYSDQFLLAAAGANAYVLDAGGDMDWTPVASALYWFDGHAWSERNASLPFRAPAGAGFYAAPDGTLGVAFSVGGQLQLWTSSDGGLHWSLKAGAGAVGEPELAERLCIGKVGREWRQGIDTRLPAGSSEWLQSSWPWSSRAHGDGSLCASDGTTYWVLGVDERQIPVMTMSDTREGESSPAYPVWYPDMPTTGSQHYFETMAAAGGRLYGVSGYSAETQTFELWRFR